MSHVRAQIRDALATLLTGLTTTGSRVFKSRERALSASELPALLIHIDDEQIEHASIGRPRLQNRLAQGVVRVVSGVDGDTEIDAAIEEIETALVAGIDSVAHDARLVAISVERDAEASPPVTTATLVIEVEYRTREGAPDTRI